MKSTISFILGGLFLVASSWVAWGQPENYFMDVSFGPDGQFTNNTPVSGIVRRGFNATSTSNTFTLDWDSQFNEWYNTSIFKNTEFTLTFQGATGLNNTSTITDGVNVNDYYTIQINGFAYSNRQAVIMETDNAPVQVAAANPVTQVQGTVAPNQPVDFIFRLAGAKSSQEKAFIRYADNPGFSGSQVEEVSFASSTDDTGTVTLPGGFNTAGRTVYYYFYTTTVAATASSNHDLITLDLANNGGSNYQYKVENEWRTTAGASDWSNPGSWESNGVPPNDVPVRISHDINLDVNPQVSALTIESGATLTVNAAGGRNIQISGVGTFTNNGGYVANNSSLIFTNGGTVAGSTPTTFGHLEVEGGTLALNTAPSISDSLTIKAGGAISTNAPTYSTGSILIYATGNPVGNPYGRNIEWSATAGAGYPHSVLVRNNTHIDLGANSISYAAIAGDLQVNLGCGLYMDYGTNDLRDTLSVYGSVRYAGEISLSDSLYGDLAVYGDLIDQGSGQLNTRERALFFLGGGDQQVAITDTVNFVIVNKSGGKLTLIQDFTIDDLTGEFDILSDSSQVEIPGGVTLNTQFRRISNDGLLVVKSGGAIVQLGNPGNNGTGLYQIERTITASDHRRFNYWSSPVEGETMGDVFRRNNDTANRSDWYFFKEEAQQWSAWQQDVTDATVLEPGRGYISTPTEQQPGNWFDPVTETRIFESDRINAGTITLNLRGSSPIDTNDFILVGNPYPSAISAEEFVQYNDSIWGTVYFWDHSTFAGLDPDSGQNFQADYASWNLTGGTSVYQNQYLANGTSNLTPNDYISSCQGFFVRVFNDPARKPVTVRFTSGMRQADNNQQFFKKEDGPKIRAWISLQNAAGDFNQTLVGFLNGATEDLDRLYDAPKFKGHPHISFYSLIDQKPFAIQGLPRLSNFNFEEKAIPLGLDAWVTGNFSIQLDTTENWPAGYNIYLVDSLLKKEVNLQKEAYFFNVQQTGSQTNRFWLVVNNWSIGQAETESLTQQSPWVYQNEEGTWLQIPTNGYRLKSYRIFSLDGRLLHHEKELSHQNRYRLPLKQSPNGVYLIEVTNGSGETYTFKTIIQ